MWNMGTWLMTHEFRSTKGSGFPPSTSKLGRQIDVLPLWFEVTCLSTPENLQQTRKLGNKSENQWLSMMFPLAKIAMNLNVIPPWRRILYKESYPEMGSFSVWFIQMKILPHIISGWWFGTWIFHFSKYLGNVILPFDELNHFSEGLAAQNHQPVWYPIWVNYNDLTLLPHWNHA